MPSVFRSFAHVVGFRKKWQNYWVIAPFHRCLWALRPFTLRALRPFTLWAWSPFVNGHVGQAVGHTFDHWLDLPVFHF
jgi:hypothetical protein